MRPSWQSRQQIHRLFCFPALFFFVYGHCLTFALFIIMQAPASWAPYRAGTSVEHFWPPASLTVASNAATQRLLKVHIHTHPSQSLSYNLSHDTKAVRHKPCGCKHMHTLPLFLTPVHFRQWITVLWLHGKTNAACLSAAGLSCLKQYEAARPWREHGGTIIQ